MASQGFRGNYREAYWVEKGKFLDGFVAATNYERKYARLLSSYEVTMPRKARPSVQQGGIVIQEARGSSLFFCR
jgi:hypothetical protein